MLVDYGFNLEAVLWSLVKEHISRQKNIELQINGTAEDLMSEARMAAAVAIQSYRIDKETKLITFLSHCVKNRLRMIARSERRRVQPEVREFDLPSDFSFQDLELDMTMKAVLEPQQYELFSLIYLQDSTLVQAATRLGISRMTAHRLNKAILERYQAVADIKNDLVSKRNLQDKWLETKTI